jgi:hypothetical protein
MNKWKWGVVGLFIAILILILQWGKVRLLIMSSLAEKWGENEQSEVPLNTPDELVSGFDATKNAPKFRIVSIDAVEKRLKLAAVYPSTWEGKEIESRITCKANDIGIVRGNGGKREKIIEQELYAEIEAGLESPMLLIGYCKDNTCSEIDRECELYVY